MTHKATSMIFELPDDKHGRGHQIQVCLETGSDGTIGIRVIGSQQLVVQPKSTTELYITTLRPDKMPAKDKQ